MERFSKYGPLKRGDVGADGRIFFAYSGGRQLWYDEKRFNEKVKICKDYETRDKELFNTKEHPPLWYYDFHKKLYYVGRTSSKERWVDYNEYLLIRKKRDGIRKRHKARCAKLKKEPLNFGDPHPSKPGLFFAYYTHNRPCWKDPEGLKKHVEARRETAGRCVRKCRIRRDRILLKVDNKVKRGTIIDGKVFWHYNTYGREVWIELAEYERRKSDSRERTRRYRERKNGLI
jgi:hypothetical protein